MELSDLMRGMSTLTGRLRYRKQYDISGYNQHDYMRVLQQEWRNLSTGETEWRDVPTVEPDAE